jgi:hypothetical protein
MAKCVIGKFDPSNRYVHFFQIMFTGNIIRLLILLALSGFELLHFYESVFPLIRESISEAIKRKLSNRDYKMEKMRGHVGNLTCRHGCVVQMMFTSWIFSNM